MGCSFLDSRCLRVSFGALPEVTSSLQGALGSGKHHYESLLISPSIALNFLPHAQTFA